MAVAPARADASADVRLSMLSTASSLGDALCTLPALFGPSWPQQWQSGWSCFGSVCWQWSACAGGGEAVVR